MFTTTQLDNGILNNYAVEPEVYFATYPSPEQQERYAKQAAFASLLVTGLFLVSLAVS
ncbi:photosystem II assembly protein Psb34 [Nodosilinea sp. E11]|uniref:photosystem II assembly protein Psb34 n=1 Tax=Nodosilinea sp. E11 TaxID=3037479 RepID=UPI002934AFA6|nr:ssl1498 family light-harvesting-like protein [Nodosilinea sp. E11]WOD41223.1 ssl1498 family light-harvesting-like protein [Nodosilinea sp. E11]